MQLQFDLKYGKVVSNYTGTIISMAVMPSMTAQGDLKIITLDSLINEK